MAAAAAPAFVAGGVWTADDQREQNNLINVKKRKEKKINDGDIIVIIPVALESTAAVAGLLLSLAQIQNPNRANWQSMTVAAHLQID